MNRPLPLLALLLPLGGCVSTVTSVVTAPVKIASSTVDAVTTSQSEADENRGRAMRKHDEALGKLDKRYRKHLKQCDEGLRQACLDARDDYADIQNLMGQQP